MYIIYYKDGSKFDISQVRATHKGVINDGETQIEAVGEDVFVNDVPPPSEVIAILQAEEGAGEWQMLSGKPYYFWNGKEWAGTDLWHVIEHFVERGLVRYSINNIEVKLGTVWKRTTEVGLYSYLTESGIVLLGTSMDNVDVRRMLRGIARDSRDIPIVGDLPPGTRIRSTRRRDETNRNVRAVR